jgi:putative methanogenesis marker 16 metalloprotein
VSPGTTRTVAEINQRLRRGEAVVMTAAELKAEVRGGRDLELADVDVVTTSTHGIMSGTSASLSLEVAPRGSFNRAASISLNGVPAFPGPAPNERAGQVDMVVYGTAHSSDPDRDYGGGSLFRDLLERKEVEVEVVTDTGKRLTALPTLDDFEFARMYNMRNGYASYTAFANLSQEDPVTTIFGLRPMAPRTEMTAIGVGELNPLANDPGMLTIGVGTRMLVNDAPGIVVGRGTRSTREHPNLSLVADMFEMRPRYVGGFATGAGMEVLNGIAVPIPVTDDRVLAQLCTALDENLTLPIADVSDRETRAEATYADVWLHTDQQLSFDPSRLCTALGDEEGRLAEALCPVAAISWQDRRIDWDRCTRCGACAAICDGGAFEMNTGAIEVMGDSVPITLRTSDRVRANELGESLKKKLELGEFELAEHTTPLIFREPKGSKTAFR